MTFQISKPGDGGGIRKRNAKKQEIRGTRGIEDKINTLKKLRSNICWFGKKKLVLFNQLPWIQNPDGVPLLVRLHMHLQEC